MSWEALVLGVVAAIGPVSATISGVFYFRQNKQRKDLAIARDVVGIQIDETTRNNLIQDAASINQKREQEREDWWSNQIKVLREEIETERRLSHKRFRRLNQLEDWATLHMSWDRKAWNRLLETDPDFDPPPVLPEEIILEVRERGGNVDL